MNRVVAKVLVWLVWGAAMGVAHAADMNIRVYAINDHVLAFYDGRPPEPKEEPAVKDWAAFGALNVGVCTYVIHQGHTALVYDTYPKVQEARWVREYLERLGITHFKVVNSHWHLDHVGGNAVYADVDRVATRRTIEILRDKQNAIEAGTEWGPPAIDPLVLPNIGVVGRTRMFVEGIKVELRPINIHSEDGLVLFLPADRLLLAGDTLEDTVTFIVEPEHIAQHLHNLEQMKKWGIQRILPNHGNPEVIAAGGYPLTLIDATVDYLKTIRLRVGDAHDLGGTLEDYVHESVARGWVSVWWAYRAAHAQNVERVSVAYPKTAGQR